MVYESPGIVFGSLSLDNITSLSREVRRGRSVGSTEDDGRGMGHYIRCTAEELRMRLGNWIWRSRRRVVYLQSAYLLLWWKFTTSYRYELLLIVQNDVPIYVHIIRTCFVYIFAARTFHIYLVISSADSKWLEVFVFVNCMFVVLVLLFHVKLLFRCYSLEYARPNSLGISKFWISAHRVNDEGKVNYRDKANLMARTSRLN